MDRDDKKPSPEDSAEEALEKSRTVDERAAPGAGADAMSGTLMGAPAANLAPPGPGPVVAPEDLGEGERVLEQERKAVRQPPGS